MPQIKRYIPGDSEVANWAYIQGEGPAPENFNGFQGNQRTIVFKAKQWLRTQGPAYEYGQDRMASKALRRHLKSEIGTIPYTLLFFFIRLIVQYLINKYFEPVAE